MSKKLFELPKFKTSEAIILNYQLWFKYFQFIRSEGGVPKLQIVM